MGKPANNALKNPPSEADGTESRPLLFTISPLLQKVKNKGSTRVKKHKKTYDDAVFPGSELIEIYHLFCRAWVYPYRIRRKLYALPCLSFS